MAIIAYTPKMHRKAGLEVSEGNYTPKARPLLKRNLDALGGISGIN